MTTYNESQTFCEIEIFIQAILTNQISVEQFKQQIIPLIKKSRRFFVDGNNYIAAIIVFKHLEQIIFKANAFKFYDSIQDLPDHVVEGFIKYVSVHDKFHRTLILSGFCLLKIAKISLNSSFFPKPIKR